ncbi:MAG TPA: alpha/beta fold hydrolase [Pyrinomonadaceae bacterium]
MRYTDENMSGAGTQAGPLAYLSEVARALESKPFRPHPLFKHGHAQTLAGYAWPRRVLLLRLRDEERMFEVEPGVRLLGHCRWQTTEARERPTILLLHGLEGSSSSRYMIGTGEKAYARGFNVIRLNLRNCGDTEHLTPTLYNSGLSGDIRAVIRELVDCDRLQTIFLVGFSLSGNIVLKMAGEDGDGVAREIAGVCAVSPSVELSACAEAIERRSNWVYQQSFMRSLRRRIRNKQKLYPELYDTSDLHLVRTIRQFDDRYTALDGGYQNADDYYKRASALPLIPNIRVPSLIIHAQDDPFIPFQPLVDSAVMDNPYVLLLAPRHGGHVSFVAADTYTEDRFWAENRAVEFCDLIHGHVAARRAQQRVVLSP